MLYGKQNLPWLLGVVGSQEAHALMHEMRMHVTSLTVMYILGLKNKHKGVF